MSNYVRGFGADKGRDAGFDLFMICLWLEV